jgi:REP element-mobilizing transposase RayT
MDDYESLSHSKWEYKYHVVFIPKCRRKTLYGELRQHPGEVFRRLATQKECTLEEGHLMPHHVHMMISIPPKYAMSQVMGYIKGKSAIHLARVYLEGRWLKPYRRSCPELGRRPGPFHRLSVSLSHRSVLRYLLQARACKLIK